MFSRPGLPLPRGPDSSPPARSWGEGHLDPTVPGHVSYPLHEALSSRGCGCGLAVVLYLLVSLLGIVVFVLFSNIYSFWGGNSHCPTHVAILAPPLSCLFFLRKKKNNYCVLQSISLLFTSFILLLSHLLVMVTADPRLLPQSHHADQQSQHLPKGEVASCGQRR